MSFSWRLGLVLLLATSACHAVNKFDDPQIIGDWKTKNDTAELEADLDGDGKAAFAVVDPTNTTGVIQYKFTWEYDDESTYDLKLECTGQSFPANCELFTRMKCDMDDDGEAMDCRDRGTFFAADTKFEFDKD
jgi:hypothetical protein